VFKGIRMAGHMGARQVTQRGLQVVDRDPERNILLVKGAVPGAVGSIVFVRPD
jgi:large subunit ribosomal protein L3